MTKSNRRFASFLTVTNGWRIVIGRYPLALETGHSEGAEESAVIIGVRFVEKSEWDEWDSPWSRLNESARF